MTAVAPLSIRRYRPDDLDAVIDIFQRAVRLTAAKDYSPAQIEAWAQVDRGRWAARRLDHPTWLALAGAQPAGFTDLEEAGALGGHLDMLFVDPDHGGRGVARALVATVEAEARRAGLRRLFTEASITARPFFERQGFRLIADQEVERNGQRLRNFRLEKPLDSHAGRAGPGAPR